MDKQHKYSVHYTIDGVKTKGDVYASSKIEARREAKRILEKRAKISNITLVR